MSGQFNLMGFGIDGNGGGMSDEDYLNALMDADVRHILGRVEITYTDPLLDESIHATADTVGRLTDPKQTADNITDTPYKWFSLNNNKLDGSFHPLPSPAIGPSVGWWSTTMSNAGGNFPGRIRFIRDWLRGGSTANGANYWSEIAAYDSAGFNHANGKAVISNISSGQFEGALANAADGDLNTYTGTSATGNVWLRVDLGSLKPITSVLVAHTSFNDRTYHGTKTEVSADGINWFTVYDSAVSGEYPEPHSGVTYLIASSEPTLTVSFDPRAMYHLRVVGDNKLNEYPTDFTVVLSDKNGVQLHAEVVENNTEVSWTKTLTTPVLGVASAKLVIHKINAPNTTAKIVEFYTSVVEVYETEDVVSIHLLEEQMFEGQTLPIGNSSSNEIDIRLYNYQGRFIADNKASPLYGLLKKNRRVKAWLGTRIKEEIKWFPLGVFWTTKWDAQKATLFADLSARDRMELLRMTQFNTSEVYVNRSVLWLATMILADAGVAPEDYVLDPALANIVIPYAWFERMSHRDALVRLSSVALARTFCDRQGRLTMQIFKPSASAIYTYSDDRSLYNTTFPVAGTGVLNHIEVQATTRAIGPTTTVFQSQEPISIPPNSTVTESFNFDGAPVTQVQEPEIIHDALIEVVSWKAYAWGIEITFRNVSGASWPVESIIVRGRKLDISATRIAMAEDVTSIRDEGKATYELSDNPFIQDINLAQTIANLILAAYKDPRHSAILDSRGHVALTLGHRVGVPDYDNTATTDYAIIRQNLNWDGALASSVECQKIGSEL